ncbi:protein of unknown function [Candidatus Methylacidiphilum fumarolicum]|uniref:Uncharacterized protein n=1 Tax=Candidatus Methylacidiphilum fumarolicum TaxID=591154 RepID=A0ABN8XDM2_9BACT|nr:protein of unknown function [Candidatus Methylacidiphilum fumarolicum]
MQSLMTQHCGRWASKSLFTIWFMIKSYIVCRSTLKLPFILT